MDNNKKQQSFSRSGNAKTGNSGNDCVRQKTSGQIKSKQKSEQVEFRGYSSIILIQLPQLGIVNLN